MSDALASLTAAFEYPFGRHGDAAEQARPVVVTSWPTVPVEIIRAAGFRPIVMRGQLPPHAVGRCWYSKPTSFRTGCVSSCSRRWPASLRRRRVSCSHARRTPTTRPSSICVSLVAAICSPVGRRFFSSTCCNRAAPTFSRTTRRERASCSRRSSRLAQRRVSVVDDPARDRAGGPRARSARSSPRPAARRPSRVGERSPAVDWRVLAARTRALRCASPLRRRMSWRAARRSTDLASR